MTDLEHETEVPERTQASAVRSCKRVYKPIYYVHRSFIIICNTKMSAQQHTHTKKKKTNVGQPTYDETVYFPCTTDL